MQEDGREEAQDYEYVTEAYGAASLSAKVTKHVARVKMPNSGLSWDDDSLVNLTILFGFWYYINASSGQHWEREQLTVGGKIQTACQIGFENDEGESSPFVFPNYFLIFTHYLFLMCFLIIRPLPIVCF